MHGFLILPVGLLCFSFRVRRHLLTAMKRGRTLEEALSLERRSTGIEAALPLNAATITLRKNSAKNGVTIVTTWRCELGGCGAILTTNSSNARILAHFGAVPNADHQSIQVRDRIKIEGPTF